MRAPKGAPPWRALILGSMLLVGISCEKPPPPAPAPPPVLAQSPAAHAAAIAQALAAAPALWAADQREAAASVVEQAYVEQFTPLEPVLRAQDPTGTLALEYAFGRVQAHLARRGDPKVLTAEVNELANAVAAAVAALPPPPPPPGTPAAPAVDAAGNPLPASLPAGPGPRPTDAPAPKLPGG